MSDITPESSFETLKKNVVDSIASYFPFEGRKNKLVVSNIRVDDRLQIDDIHSQAEAKDSSSTWGVPIKADIQLVNKQTGKVLDTKKGTVLARLPKLTARYGFIVGGSEYQVDHLFRLKPGVYARIQNNGDLEAEFNSARSRFSVALNQRSKQFTIKMGNSNIPLYPVLKAAGVADDQIEKEWGHELFAANHRADHKDALAKLFKKTSESESDDPQEHSKNVATFFDQVQIRPEVTKATLGKPFEKVNGEVLQRAATKLLNISRGIERPDDRDSLAYKEVAAVEDFIPERILHNARNIKGRMRNTVDHRTSIDDIISTRIFSQPIEDFFKKGGSITERSDQTNPIAMLSAHRKTTLMARDSGGIKSSNQLTDEMRIINPSQFGFLDPMHTPESERTGITLHLAANARKNGKDLEAPVYSLATGKREWLKVGQFHSASVVLPDQVKWEDGKPRPIAAMVKTKKPGGDIELAAFKDAQYVLPSAKGMFDYASNLIPFLPCDQGNRVSMADKQIEQAISLKHREAPLVQAKTDSKDPNHTFERFVGEFVASRAPVTGKVVQVKPGSIVIQNGKEKHEIQTYDNFPLNDPKGMMHSESLVKVGDEVKKGQVVADTNFTKNGTLAIGSNLRVGYIPYKGYNYEDGIVISETAAKKLTSEHLYKKDLELDPAVDTISRAKFFSHLQTKSALMPRDHKDALDEEGIIKPGTKVVPGQVLVAAVSKNTSTKAHSVLAGLNRGFSQYRDKSLTWDEDHIGTVTKVLKQANGKGVKIYVRTDEQAVVGDKLSGRHGNKGIITQILPDHEMPYTSNPEGEHTPLEVLLNPSGVPTRINVGQMLETAAAKVAVKTGKPFIVDNFAGPNHDYRQQVLDELKKHGLNDEEDVFDPDDPKKALGSVLVGPQYLLKLKHQVEKKLTVRGGGTDLHGKPLKYDVDNQPVKGSDAGGQGFGQLDLYALLGHNARSNLREMATYKSDKQDGRFWSWVQSGREPPPPRPPFSYEKFTGMLKGMGVNVERVGTAVRLMPMTNKEILRLADNGKNELKQPHRVLRQKDLREEPGGLFDPQATGGKDGDKWSFIRLAEPIPNPVFVGEGVRPGPVPVLLGKSLHDIDAIMAGRQELNGKTGGAAIEAALKKISVADELKKVTAEVQHLTGDDLDRANKKMKYLLALKEFNLAPHEAYILKSLPVLPPKFRPVMTTPNGDVNFASLNGLYKNLALINKELKEYDDSTFSADHKVPLRTQYWDAAKAIQSIGNYRSVYDTDNSGNRELKGVLDIISGDQPKKGFFQSKLVKRRQNLSIRSTIVPEPALGIDEVGLPKNAAMELYKPFVMAHLLKQSFTPLKAEDEMRRFSPVAFRALEKVIEDRPILLKRDPVLHKFSVMAFKPKLVEGKAIQIHPLVTGGFNADFDGDTMAGTVPLSREAVEEAKKMFPSQNLFSSTSGQVMYLPSQESLLGLHLLSQWGKPVGKSFESVAELKKAVHSHSLGLNDVVKVKGAKKETTLGRLLIAETLPSGFPKNVDILHDPTYEITKPTMSELAPVLAKDYTHQFAKTIDALKNLGNEYSYRYGFSIGLKDLAPVKGRDGVITRSNAEAAKVRSSVKGVDEQDKQVVKIYEGATKELDALARQHLMASGNRLATMVYSGSRGKRDQLRQMIAAPMLMQDSMNRTIPQPVTKSYSEGLDVGDYFLAQHGARKGTMQRALGTSEPGRLSKDILNTTIATLITENDCGTNQGILMDLTHKDIVDRYTAKPYKLKDGTLIREGSLLTPAILTRLKNNKEDRILVRSPLKCELGDGICAKCFGLNENAKLHDVGTNIGVLAGQALGEPAVQMAMDAFHSGGVASSERGAKSVDRFTRLDQLLQMPKKLRDAATVATASGKVTSVKKDAVGGVDVLVNSVSHYVPKHLVDEKIVAGRDVKKGDKLSEGFINPHDLLGTTKDIHAVQHYLTSEMYDGLYEKEGVRRRNVEVAVRALTNLTKIKDPGSSDYIHGDVAPRSVVEEYNRSLAKGKEGITHEPILKGIERIPSSISNDWMSRLNYQQLPATIQHGASVGAKSELHGSHPIPGIAFGAEFGKPPPGSKKHVY